MNRRSSALRITCRGITDPLSGDRCEKPFQHDGDDRYAIDAARAAGWRIHRWPDGILDAMCPACGKPDPITVAMCRDLERSTTT